MLKRWEVFLNLNKGGLEMKCKKHKRELTRIEVKSGWGSSFIDVCPVCQAVANRILSKSEIDYSKYEGVEPAHAWQLPEFKAL